MVSVVASVGTSIGATVGATLGDTTAGHILYDGFKHTGEEFADYLHNSENAQAVLETGEKIKDTTIGTAKEAEKMVTNAHNTAVNATVQVAETAKKKYNELIKAEVQGLENLANSKVKDVVNVDTIVGINITIRSNVNNITLKSIKIKNKL